MAREFRLSRSSGLAYPWPSRQKWDRPSLFAVCQSLARPTARQTTKTDRLSHLISRADFPV